MGKIVVIQEEKKMNAQSGEDGSNSEEEDISHSVSFDGELTAGGLCGDMDDVQRYPPLSGVIREQSGRKWDFDSDGKPNHIGGNQ